MHGDCFTCSMRSIRPHPRRTLYSPPFVVQNWAVLHLRRSAISTLNKGDANKGMLTRGCGCSGGAPGVSPRCSDAEGAASAELSCHRDPPLMPVALLHVLGMSPSPPPISSLP